MTLHNPTDSGESVGPQAESVRLIETMRCSTAGIVNKGEHLTRLSTSAAELGFMCNRTAIEAELDAWRALGIDTVLRLLLHPDGSVHIEARDIPDSAYGTVSVDLDDRPMPAHAWWTRHKTTYRGPYEDARRRHPHTQDVILFNTEGSVTESTVANIAAFVDGRWVTPPLSTGCLPGTERAVRLRAGDLVEGNLTVNDVLEADGLMLISSVRGLRHAAFTSESIRR